MKTPRLAAFVLAACLLPSNSTSLQTTVPREQLSSPIYFLAVSAKVEDPHEIHFRGASNMPPGAKIGVVVTKFSGYGWEYYSESVCVSLDANGLFSGNVPPKQGMVFPSVGDLVLAASFQTNLCKPQPSTVLEILGKKGERLANVRDSDITELSGLSHNPQLYQVSGWYYGIQTIGRIE